MTLSVITNFLDTGPSILEMLLRIFLTAIFVGVIGVNRQLRHKIAGVTTHLMVAFGACGIAILQDVLYLDALETAKALAEQGYTYTVEIERQRVIAQVVTGVGFLGAGAILKTKFSIFGLTTAATLWLSAMIGLCFGLGAYLLGIILSVVSILFLTLFRSFLERTPLKHVEGQGIIGSKKVDE
jgi:putative Mg2+ transporter-C (MgtC) family protein